MRYTILAAVLGLGFFLAFSLALAQESSPNSIAPSPSPSNYALPYPGILPDHPLYLLKKIRDQILLLLITNPVRRVEFQILLADKHLNMGVFLVRKKNPRLATTTIVRGVGYLRKAGEYLFQIPGGKSSDVMSLKDRYEQSLFKHQEIVSALRQELTGEESVTLTSASGEIEVLLQEFKTRK